MTNQNEEPRASPINIYLLSFASGNIIKFNELFLELLSFEEFQATLIDQRINERENKAAYSRLFITSLKRIKENSSLQIF